MALWQCHKHRRFKWILHSFAISTNNTKVFCRNQSRSTLKLNCKIIIIHHHHHCKEKIKMKINQGKFSRFCWHYIWIVNIKYTNDGHEIFVSFLSWRLITCNGKKVVDYFKKKGNRVSCMACNYKIWFARSKGSREIYYSSAISVQ